MNDALDWLQTSTGGLLLLCGVAIAVLLFLIIKIKLEPFIALFLAGIGLAVAAGLTVEQMVGSALSAKESIIETGFGGVLGHIALIIGLGTVLGSLLERSGGADVLAQKLLGLFGERYTSVAMGLVGLIFGIPVFFDIGIFVLAPLVYVAAHRGGRTLVLYALPVLAGLSMTHAFLPPHPGPTALGGLLGVDLGWLIILGLLCGLPAFAAAGILFPLWIAPRIDVRVPDEFLVAETEAEDRPVADPVPLGQVLGVIAFPLLLILGATFGSIILDPSRLLSFLTFVGNPAVALTLAVLLAYWLLGIRRGMTREEISEFTGASLRPVGMILLVVGAGAFFGSVISATGVGTALADVLSDAGLPVLLLAYVISCALRIAQGSATVAIVTTGGIVAPTLEADYSQPQLAVIAVAIAAGSIILSHVNDGGFWIVSRYFNLSVKETLMTWTVLETVLSVTGFAAATVAWVIV
jgi:GntP family gluconate:H+ symporter